MINGNDVIILLCAEGITPKEVERRIKMACEALDTGDEGEDLEDNEDNEEDFPHHPETFTQCFLHGEGFKALETVFIPPETPRILS